VKLRPWPERYWRFRARCHGAARLCREPIEFSWPYSGHHVLTPYAKSDATHPAALCWLCPKLALAMSALCGECPRRRWPEHQDACSPAAAAVDCGVHCAPRNNVPVRVLLHTESAEVQSVALRRSPRRCRGSFVNTGGTRVDSSSGGQCTRRRHVAAASTADGTPLHLKKWGLCCWCGPPPACKTHSLRIGAMKRRYACDSSGRYGVPC